jgi:hypothetical protein
VIRAMLLLAMPLLITNSVAYADEMPARKPGLWEINTTQSGSPTDVSRLRIDAPTKANLMAKANAATKEICSRHDTHREGDAITEDSVCNPMSSRMTTHAVTTFHGDSAYTRIYTSHYDPPFTGKTETNMTQEGKWLGACEPGMKPGDFFTHGKKLNVGGKS